MRWYYILIILVLKTNAECPPTVEFYPCRCVQYIPLLTDKYFWSSINVTTYDRSILCENIDTALNMKMIFDNLTEILSVEYRNFDSFSLRNTTIGEIPSNAFGNLTFLIIQFEDNPYLSTIDPEAFTNINAEYVQVFETSNTNLSQTIFETVLNKFENLLRITMLNDNVQHIPSFAFRQSNLRHIWFGLEGTMHKQPLKSIDSYAFYHVSSLGLLRIISDDLSQFNQYSFAIKQTSELIPWEILLIIGGQQISSKSFPLTSLTHFGNRLVSLWFYDTPNLKYLDEAVFKPFLGPDGAGREIDLAHSQSITYETEPTCPCEMYWIQRDYYRLQGDFFFPHPVYGYPCWFYDFSACENVESDP